MKRSFILLFSLLVTSSFAHAQTPATLNQTNPIEHAYLGFGGVLDIPTQNLNNYNLGGGVELIGGYCFNDYVSIQTRIDNFYFYGNNISIADFRPSFELKLAMDLKDFFQPYCFLGPSADIQYISVNGITSNSISLAAVGGLGVQFDLGDRIAIFIEGKYNFTFQNTTATNSGGLLEDIPAEAGMTFGL